MKDSALAQLLGSSDAKASGEFVCQSDGAEIHVFLQAGRVAWATNSKNPLAFKHRLKEHAHLDEDSYQQVMSECHRTHAPIGETLVAWKLATMDQVRDALSGQVAQTLELLDECQGPGKAVFLARPQYAQYNLDLTFDIRGLLSAAKVGLGPSHAPAPPAVAPPHPPVPTSAPSSSPAVPTTAAPLALDRGTGSSRRVLIAVAALAVVAGAIAGLLRFSRSSEQKPWAPVFAVTAPPAQAVTAIASHSRGVTDTEVVFGMSSAFSGAVKDLGREMRKGFEVAFAAKNEAGGVHGRKIRLVALDDGYDPSRTLQVMQELVENRKVLAVVGNVGSAPAAVSLPYALEKQVVFFGPLSGSAFLRKHPPDRFIFNFRPSYAEETATAVRYLVEVRRVPASQIAVFYQDDDFGQAGLLGVEEEVRKQGGDPAQMVKMTYRRNSADVAEALEVVKKERARVRAVVMVATSQAAVQFIEHTKDLGAAFILTNVSAVNSNALAEGLVSAGKGYTTDVLVTQIVPHPNASSTAALECQAAMAKHAGGEAPGFVSFEGFIAGKILLEGLERAGRDLDTESLIAGLEKIHDLDLGLGVAVTFGPEEHQSSHKVWGTALQPDGTYKSIKLE